MNKRSKLLELVLKNYGGEDRTPPSANAFIMEVLKFLNSNLDTSSDNREDFADVVGEVNAILDFFNQEGIEVYAFLKAMEKALNGNQGDFFDAVIFTKTMRELEMFSSTHGDEAVTCLDICQRIFASPTKVIRSAIEDVHATETDRQEAKEDAV